MHACRSTLEDPTGELLHETNYAPGGTINSRFDYTYDLLDQITSMTTLDGTWTYSYDAGKQLVRAIFTSTNPSIPNQDLAYSYDAVGNRISTIINGVTTNYTVNSLNEYTNVGGTARVYDLTGNLIFDGTNTFTYNQLNQLTGVSGPSGAWQFTYNALGQRVSSTFNGQTTSYLNDPIGMGNVLTSYSGATTLSHFDYGFGLERQLVASSGAGYFYDQDALGSTVGLTDSSGAYVNQYRYLPFGSLLQSSGTVANPFQFAGTLGVQTDAAGLLDMRARDYNPAVGSFITPDPLQFAGGSQNFYSYVFNAPLAFVDPSGLRNGRRGGPGQSSTQFKKVDGPGTAFLYPPSVTEYSVPESTALNILKATWDDIKSELKDSIVNWHLPDIDKLETNFLNTALNEIKIGPFPLGSLELQLLKPEVALQVVDAINALRRQALCGTINAYEAKALLEIGEASAGCEDAPGLLPIPYPQVFHDPYPPRSKRQQQIADIINAFDPNDKIGPGVGTSGFVADGSTISYKIDFENDPTATAPAQQVVITDKLSADLDWSSMRLIEVGWGDIVITIPPDTQQFQTTTTMTYNGHTFDVHVLAGINLVTGMFTAQFYSIDPATQLPPDVLIGFLPPEDGTDRGMGHIRYSANAKPGFATGKQIRNVANISFDAGQIVATNQVSETDPSQGTDPAKEALVTIDAGAPTSTVAPLPSQEIQAAFPVSWSGTDDTGGSGIAAFSIFVSTDGGPFTLWLSNTAATSAMFNGAAGHSYGFYSVAVDNVGNTQPTPTGAQATTAVVSSAPLNLTGPTAYIRIDADGVNVDVWTNATASGTPQQTLKSQISSMSFTGSAAANDTLIIDYTNGDPIVSSGISLDGGGGNDVLRIIGSGGNDLLNVNAGTFTLPASPGGIVSITEGTLSIASSATVRLAANASHADRTVLVLSTLNLAGSPNAWTSTLDLGGNDMIVHQGNVAILSSIARSGFDSGGTLWAGTGLADAQASADSQHLTGIGLLLNTASSGGVLIPSFDGQPSSSTDVLLKHTYLGDANLNGSVNAADYSSIDNGYAMHLTGWINGDFNYDGTINAADYSLIDTASAFQSTSAGPLAAADAVPVADQPVAAPAGPFSAMPIANPQWMSDPREASSNSIDTSRRDVAVNILSDYRDLALSGQNEAGQE